MQPTPVSLSGESPWTEEPGGLQSKESDTTEATKHARVVRNAVSCRGEDKLVGPLGLGVEWDLTASIQIKRHTASSMEQFSFLESALKKYVHMYPS